MRRKTLFIRELPNDEEYVDFNRQKLNLLGYVFCQLEVGNSKLQKARILVAEKEAKSLIGRDWLNAFNYKVMSPNQTEVKNAFYRINAKLEHPNETNKPGEVEKESKIDRKNDNTEQPELKE